MRDKQGALKILVGAIRDLSSANSLQAVMDITKHAAQKISGAEETTFVLREGAVSRETNRPAFAKSFVMVPIRAEAPMGEIGIYWSSVHKPKHDDIQLLQALADTVSVALENLRLYSSLQERIKDLDRANKTKDEFLLTLSHELRTPLNAILGWAQLLAAGALDKPDYVTAVETIERNARGQANLINDLLDSSRIMAGRFQIESKPVDLAQLIRKAMASIQPTADRKLIRIATFGLENFDGMVNGDEQRLQQIVVNLLSNSVKFTPSRGEIEILLTREGPSARIDITDNGAGIDGTFIPTLFERFRQANSSSTRRFGGLGLGLSIVKHLVQAHGGEVMAKSPGLGRGSTFTIFLPLSSPEQRKARIVEKHESTALPTLKGIRILVVDDEPDVRVLVSRILAKQGAHVKAAASADEAFAILDECKPQLLICDLSMPDVDGFALVQKLRKLKNTVYAGIPAIALTAYADKESERKALASGFTAFMGKPFPLALLLKTIRSLVRPVSESEIKTEKCQSAS